MLAGVQGRSLFQSFGDSLKQLAGNATAAITKPVEGAISTVKNGTETAIGAVKNTTTTAVGAVKNTTQTVTNPVKDATSTVTGTLSNVTNAITGKPPGNSAGMLTFSSAAFGIMMLAQLLLV